MTEQEQQQHTESIDRRLALVSRMVEQAIEALRVALCEIQKEGGTDEHTEPGDG